MEVLTHRQQHAPTTVCVSATNKLQGAGDSSADMTVQTVLPEQAILDASCQIKALFQFFFEPSSLLLLLLLLM